MLTRDLFAVANLLVKVTRNDGKNAKKSLQTPKYKRCQGSDNVPLSIVLNALLYPAPKAGH